MGHSTRGNGIRTYWPDNTDDTLYINVGTFYANYTMQEIVDICENKWPGVSLVELNVRAENIQTDCLGHDMHDSGDYTDFLIIERETTDA